MTGSLSVPSGTFAGRYTIEREIGRGATATVFLARDGERGRAVAIKVLRPELAQTIGSERFLRETRISERLHHPHVVPVLDAGESDGQLYFVLPYMEGGSLRQRLEREKQLPVATAIEVTRSVAEALDYAHREGLIHRDVKPENILFTSGQACLADFGIARAIERAIDESTTSTGLVRGTPAYMSPEQASGSTEYDGRSDQYSLALVLYEMLAGVPAFIGPTPEAIIAQRFYHAPRELRVYRQSVPTGVEEVIAKALSLAAADRYLDMAAFTSALDDALRTANVVHRGFRRPSLRQAIGLVAAASVIGVGTYFGATRTPSDVVPDTTRYVVLPAAGDSAPAASEATQGLLRALDRWKGLSAVTPFELDEALGGDPVPRTEKAMEDLARRVGAGRVLRADLQAARSDTTVHVALFQVGRATPLAEASVGMPVAGRWQEVIDSLVAVLLLRRERGSGVGSMHLPAAQLFLAAMDAREAFDLRSADSLLLQALEYDRDFGRAALALAQVRAWREDEVTNWLPWAERARNDSRLAADEVDLAAALVAMGRRDHPAGCRILSRQAARADAGFDAWMTLGTCLRTDNIVVPSRSSASGWRFRSSYQSAVNAYVRAFQLAPALHRTFQAGGYERLRNLLFTGPLSLRGGRAAFPDSQRFLAYATWRDDSLVFVPYPDSMLPRGLVPMDSAGRQLAVRRERDLFRQIAQSWAAALPTNPAAKEALAISLEMVGDPTALDTLRVARAMPSDLEQRVRLGAEEVLTRVSLGRRDLRHLEGAGRLADSLVTAFADSAARFVAILRPIAAMTGRCAMASSFAARSAETRNSRMHGVPHHVYAAAESVTVLATMGCDAATTEAGITSVERLVEGLSAGAEADVQRRRYALLARAVRLSDASDSVRLVRYAASNGDQLMTARLNLLRGDTARVRAFLERPQTVALADRSPDFVFAEAKLFLAIGDTARAVEWLKPVLNRVSWLEIMLDRPMEAAALVRGAALVSRLDPGAPRVWGALPRELWTHADAASSIRDREAGNTAARP